MQLIRHLVVTLTQNQLLRTWQNYVINYNTNTVIGHHYTVYKHACIYVIITHVSAQLV